MEGMPFFWCGAFGIGCHGIGATWLPGSWEHSHVGDRWSVDLDTDGMARLSVLERDPDGVVVAVHDVSDMHGEEAMHDAGVCGWRDGGVCGHGLREGWRRGGCGNCPRHGPKETASAGIHWVTCGLASRVLNGPLALGSLTVIWR